MRRFFASLIPFCASFFIAFQSASAVTIAWSPVGNGRTRMGQSERSLGAQIVTTIMSMSFLNPAQFLLVCIFYPFAKKISFALARAPHATNLPIIPAIMPPQTFVHRTGEPIPYRESEWVRVLVTRPIRHEDDRRNGGGIICEA